MIFKKEVWITPYQMNRRLHIYVPQRAMEEGRRCPVLYMFDGHNLFEDQEATYGKSWGLKDYLDHSGLPLIVVGMECNHEGNSRLVEYSPYTFTDHQFGTIAGSGRQMMRWVVDELKPLIDRELPTLTSRKDTWIAGSSMGGLMSLYTITAHNDTFSKAACLSPSCFRCAKTWRENAAGRSTRTPVSIFPGAAARPAASARSAGSQRPIWRWPTCSMPQGPACT